MHLEFPVNRAQPPNTPKTTNIHSQECPTQQRVSSSHKALTKTSQQQNLGPPIAFLPPTNGGQSRVPHLIPRNLAEPRSGHANSYKESRGRYYWTHPFSDNDRGKVCFDIGTRRVAEGQEKEWPSPRSWIYRVTADGHEITRGAGVGFGVQSAHKYGKASRCRRISIRDGYSSG